jgi:hypothetical protein
VNNLAYRNRNYGRAATLVGVAYLLFLLLLLFVGRV